MNHFVQCVLYISTCSNGYEFRAKYKLQKIPLSAKRVVFLPLATIAFQPKRLPKPSLLLLSLELRPDS